MTVHLFAQELEELTQRRRPSAQARALVSLKIPYRKRPDGTLVVYRSHFDAHEKNQPA